MNQMSRFKLTDIQPCVVELDIIVSEIVLRTFKLLTQDSLIRGPGYTSIACGKHAVIIGYGALYIQSPPGILRGKVISLHRHVHERADGIKTRLAET